MANIEHFLQTMRDVKPAGAKSGRYMDAVYVCTAMGPSIRLAVE